ncbi:MAG: hypothetical protein JWO06_2693 [Bacteroidota bacterium]|nr:hypothetical protein [Bacteroidota bacterium]
MVKFGINQIENPSPVWMDRLINALIIIVMPAFAAFVLAVPNNIINADVKNFLGAFGTFIIAVLKGLQFLIGEEKTG